MSRRVERLLELAGDNHVARLAAEWAAQDGIQQWILAAPGDDADGSLLREVVLDYLAVHNPFPPGSSVLVDARGRFPAETGVVVERVAADEWVVDLEAYGWAYRDASELRPERVS